MAAWVCSRSATGDYKTCASSPCARPRNFVVAVWILDGLRLRAAALRGMRRELPAGAVDLTAAGISYGHRHALGLQPSDELVLVSTPGGGPNGTRGRVYRDQVDVDPAPVATPPQHPRQEVSPERLVIDVSDEDVLDRHSAFGEPGVLPRGVHDFSDVPAGVDRHQFVAQLVVRRMERKRQGDRDPLCGQLLHSRDQAYGRHGDAASTHAQAVRCWCEQLTDGVDDSPIVRQGLPHPHEDHVGDPRTTPGNLTTVELAGAVHHLLHDLCGAEIAL